LSRTGCRKFCPQWLVKARLCCVPVVADACPLQNRDSLSSASFCWEAFRFGRTRDSKIIAKYDRRAGQRLALSFGEASHLNNGAWWEGRLYCAHPNFPHKPDESEVRVLDPETMILTVFKDLGEGYDSLT